MAKRVQRVRHTEINADRFVGLEGEITIDLSNHRVRVHDGITAGGHQQAAYADLFSLETIERLQELFTQNPNMTDLGEDDDNAGGGSDNDTATITWDVSKHPNAYITATEALKILNPLNAVEGGYYIITIIQDATGGRTVTWDTDYSFRGIGGTPTLSTAPGARDKFGFAYEDGVMRAISCVLDY